MHLRLKSSNYLLTLLSLTLTLTSLVNPNILILTSLVFFDKSFEKNRFLFQIYLTFSQNLFQITPKDLKFLR